MWIVRFGKIQNAFFVTLRSRHQKSIGGRGAPAAGVGWCIRSHFLFFIFSFFIFWFSVVFYFLFCFQCVDIVGCSCFCYFFVLAIVVQSCRIRFKRIYLRSVAFKLFFGVVGSLMCFYALRSEINEFFLFLVFVLVFICLSLLLLLFLFSRSFFQ